MFVQLQDALRRARSDGRPEFAATVSGSAEGQRGPPSTPSQSPIGRSAPRPAANAEDPSAGHATTAGQATSAGTAQAMVANDFFGDELRGYRLIKGSRLTTAERQNVLVQTQNSTAFYPVRRALRTLFSDEDEGWRKPKVWWNEESADGWEPDETWQDGAHDPGHYAWWYGDETYDDDGSTWNAYYDDWTDDWEWEDPQELAVDDQTTDPTELQYKEAYALANEATRTLSEAREAVRKVRAARGYFAPESATGKGLAGSPSSSRSSWSPKGSSSGKGKFLGAGKGKGFGPCFICGMKGHIVMHNVRIGFPKEKGTQRARVLFQKERERTRAKVFPSQYSFMT